MVCRLLFERWYKQQPPSIQQNIQQLVANGQLEIVNGGLAPLQDSLTSLNLQLSNLDQGLSFLNSTFGPDIVRVAWQVGSRSHSSLSPTLYAAFGYTHAVLGGLGEDVRDVMMAKGSMEFKWLGADLKAIYAHVLYAGYAFPSFLDPRKEEYCWKQGKMGACAMQLIAYSHTISHYYPSHNCLFIPYGDDLFWSDDSNPIKVLKRSEAIMSLINANNTNQIHIQWGTPSDYFRSAAKTTSKVLSYIGDFHPYMTHYVTAEYWTGLYSLQPLFKRRVHEAGELLRFASLLSTVVLDREIKVPGVVLSAHEGVLGGLESRDLLSAYREVLDRGIDKTLETIQEAAFGLLHNVSKSDTFPAPYRPIFLYNPLNWAVETLYRFQSSHLSFRLLDHSGAQVPCEAIPSPGSNNYTVFFAAKLESLSISVWAVIEDCRDCVPLAGQTPGNRLFREGKSWEVAFQTNGKVRNMRHISLGNLPFRQDFLAVKSARSEAHLFLPNYVGYTSESHQFPLYLRSFAVYSGEICTAAVSIWLHNRQIFTQTLLIPAHSDILIWEITSFALDNEDLLLGLSLPLDSNNALKIATFDGYSWSSRRTEETKSGFEIGRNFYPVSGALRLSQGVIIIPKTPIGVGTVPEAYLFHLQRSKKQGDFGISTAQFTLTTAAAWPKPYYEAKTFNLMLGLTQNGRFADNSPMNFPPVTVPWSRETKKRLGIESNDLYLASISKRGDKALLRIQPFLRDPTLTMDWEGVNIEEETDASGYHAVNAGIESEIEWLSVRGCCERETTTFPVFLQAYLAEISLFSLEKDWKSGKNPKFTENIMNKTDLKAENSQQIEAFLPSSELEISSNDLTVLEYSLFLSLSVLSIVGVCCFLRNRKRRID